MSNMNQCCVNLRITPVPGQLLHMFGYISGKNFMTNAQEKSNTISKYFLLLSI